MLSREEKNVKKRKSINSSIAGYLLIAPLFLGVFIFVLYPMLQVFIYSFEHTNGVASTFAGLKNYQWILSDRMFWNALKNTAFMAVISVVLDIVVCFVIASLINSLVIGKSMFKSIYYLPNVVSTVAVAMLFNFLFFPSQDGIINYFLSIFGIKPIGWLVNPGVAKFSLVLMGLWRSIGYDTILFLAGLQSVPREIYEAAEVDGASGLKKWFYITIPNMKPTFVFMAIMLTISNLKRFDDVWMIGGLGGNPGGALQTVVLYVYRNAWVSKTEVGVASAASVVLFIITVGITIINNRMLNRNDD